MYERQILEPADALVQRHGSRLRYFELALNVALHTALLRGAENRGARIEKRGTGLGSFHSFWRPAMTDGESPIDDLPGYWVREGSDNTPL